MRKVEIIIKFLMALMCELEKVQTVSNLRFILMHVFSRINLRMNILASRAVLSLNLLRKPL